VGKRKAFLKSNSSGDTVEKFAPIERPVAIRAFMEDAELTEAHVVIWLHNRLDIMRTKIGPNWDVKSHFFAVIPERFEIEKFVESIRKQPASDVQVFIYLKDKAIIGFQTDFVSVEDGKMKLVFPKKAYRVQRRKHQRYRLRQGYLVEARYHNPNYLQAEQARQVYDISAGGLSFIIDHKEVPDYKVGMIMRHVQVAIRNKPILVDAEVKNIVLIEPHHENPKYKVGLLFRRILPEDVEFLESYIIENTVQFG